VERHSLAGEQETEYEEDCEDEVDCGNGDVFALVEIPDSDSDGERVGIDAEGNGYWRSWQ